MELPSHVWYTAWVLAEISVGNRLAAPSLVAHTAVKPLRVAVDESATPPLEQYTPLGDLVSEQHEPLPEYSTQAASKTGWVSGLGLLALTGLSFLTGCASVRPIPPPEVAISQPVETPTTITTDVPASEVVRIRNGELLSSGRILKFDQYPGLQRAGLPESIEGAPNFREVDGTGIHGVAQPTVPGLRRVLDRLDAREREVVWTTMREEPVVYVQGRSYSLRLEDKPINNLEEYPGISAEAVEQQEELLKQEVLREAERFGGKLLVHGEAPDGTITTEWVEVGEGDVKTPKEVFSELRAEGYQVDYARVPITDERAPEDKDFDALVQRLGNVSPDTPLVFNCHAGRGRTTTAMVVADLVRHAQAGEGHERFSGYEGVREDIKDRYQRGEYRAILSMMRLLESGPESKAEADRVIDRFSDLQNLREDILKYKNRAEGDPAAERRGLDYLERYFKLINFNEYVREQAPAGFQQSYEDWVKERPQLQQLLETLQLAMGVAPAAPGPARYA